MGSETVCIDHEISFEIPQNWHWVRLSSIANIVMGSSPKSQNICFDDSFIEFHQGKIYFTKRTIGSSNQYTCETTKIAPNGSVLLCIRAPVGEVNITDRDICIGRGLSSIHPCAKIPVEFLFYWLQPYKKELINKSTGSTFSAVTSDTVQNILLPLPPIEEQRRILLSIENLMRLLENVESGLK